MEMPIFDMTLRTPLPSALMRLRMAFSGVTSMMPCAREVLDALHREVGVDRGGAVPDEQGDLVHLADVPGLDEQRDLGALLGADEVVVDRRGQQQ